MRFAWLMRRDKNNAAQTGSAVMFRWPLIVAIFGGVLIFGLESWFEWGDRNVQIQETKASLVNLATSLSQHADETVEIADAVVSGVVAQLENFNSGNNALPKLDFDLLWPTVVRDSHHAIIILDAKGNWLTSSLSARGGNFADREYFRHHHDDTDRSMFIGPPIENAVNGRWSVTVSRRYQNADGSFAGVVLAVIDLDQFSNYYSQYNLGDGGTIIFITDTGILLARHPAYIKLIGHNVASSTLNRELENHATGSYVSVSPVDGVLHFAGFHRSKKFPFVIVTTITDNQALDGWRHHMRIHMLVAIGLIAGMWLLFWHLLRQTERSQAAEQQLRKSQKDYQQLLESGGVTDAIYLLSDDGRIETWNAGAQQIKGYTAAEAIGQNFSLFFTPDDFARGEPARLLAVTRDNGSYTTTGWRVRKDGSRFWACVSVEAIVKDDGTLRGYSKVTRDITGLLIAEEQRAAVNQAQKALIESEERFRLLLHSNVTDALYLLDPEGNVESWNASAERIKGYTSEEIIGQNFSKFFTPDDIASDVPKQVIKEASETGRFSGEAWRVRKDGSYILARVAIDAIYNDDRTVRGFVKVTQDITQQRKEEGEFEIV